MPPDPLILGSGNGRLDNYVGRALPDGNEDLLYHHTVGGVVVWGTIKRIQQNDDGTLRLMYWPGLDGLETDVLFDADSGTEFGDLRLAGTWRTEDGTLVGQADPKAPAVFQLPANTADMMLTCRIKGDPDSQSGLLCRFDGEQGIGVVIDRGSRTMQITELRREGEQYVSTVLDTRNEAPLADGADQLRVLARGYWIGVHLNDEWMFGMTIPELFTGAGLGAIVTGGKATFDNVRIAEIEPLVETDP